jgi:Xaa-Pro aminopeptidase
VSLSIDFHQRVGKVRAAMSAAKYDAVVLTSYPSAVYLSGAGFTPYRPGVAVVVTQKDLQVIIRNNDVDRMHYECWIPDIKSYYPFGKGIVETIIESLETMKVSKGTVGFEIYPEQNWAVWSPTLFDKIRAGLSGATIVDATLLMAEIMLVKEEAEIQIMRQAAAICDIGFDTSIKAIRPGVTEIEVGAEAEYAMRKAGAAWFACPPIVASGFRAAYINTGETCVSEKIIRRGELICLDYTPIYNNYMGDAARMVSVGEPSREQKKIMDVTVDIYQQYMDMLKPGAVIGDVVKKVHDLTKKNGYGLGTGALWHQGHGLGIPAHILPFMVPTCTTVIKANMVFAPNVCIAPGGVEGGGLEEMVLIREDGAEMLCRTPRTLHIVNA